MVPCTRGFLTHGLVARATVVLAALIGTCAFAQPVPAVKSVSPDVIRRGETTRVAIVGEHLGEASEVIFAGPAGVTAKLVKDEKKSLAGPLVVDVTATADAPRGLRQIRVVTKDGVTKPLLISVDDLPAVAEKEPNNAPAEAQ